MYFCEMVKAVVQTLGVCFWHTEGNEQIFQMCDYDLNVLTLTSCCKYAIHLF